MLIINIGVWMRKDECLIKIIDMSVHHYFQEKDDIQLWV